MCCGASTQRPTQNLPALVVNMRPQRTNVVRDEEAVHVDRVDVESGCENGRLRKIVIQLSPACAPSKISFAKSNWSS